MPRTPGGAKEQVIAVEVRRTQNARNVGHVSHDAQTRIDKRVAKILAGRHAGRRIARVAVWPSKRG
jgi:hypothetical protein